MSADGPEQRTAEREERFDATFDALMTDGQLADEARDDLRIPVRCIVRGCDWATSDYCWHCGTERVS